MVQDYLSQRRDARKLVRGGVADSEEEAIALMKKQKEQLDQSDLMIFYQDFGPVRQAFTGVIDETPYNFSNIRIAFMKSGFLDRARKWNKEHKRLIAPGKITEFASEDEEVIRLVGLINNFRYEGKDGIFLSPWSAEEVHKKGKKTYDEKNGLYRIEFEPVGGDYILGMFPAWSRHQVNDLASLVLYIPKDQVTVFGKG